MPNRRETNTTGNQRLRENGEVVALIHRIEVDLNRDTMTYHLSLSDRAQLGRDIRSLEGILKGKEPTTMETKLWMKREPSMLDTYLQ